MKSVRQSIEDANVESSQPGNVPYAIPRPGRLWLGKSPLAAYEPDTIYSLPPGFARNGSVTDTVVSPAIFGDRRGQLQRGRRLRRLDSSDNNTATQYDFGNATTIDSRLRPLDSRDSPSLTLTHVRRIPRPILHIGVFNVGLGAVASTDHDLSAEFFCSPPTPTDGRGTLSLPTTSHPSSTSATGSRRLHRSTVGPLIPSADVAPADFGNPFLPEIRGEPDGSPDYVDDSASVGGSSNGDDMHVPPCRSDGAVPRADDPDNQCVHQEPATWPEIRVEGLATVQRMTRRTVSHDESAVQAATVSGRTRQTLYRQKKNWTFDAMSNNNDNKNNNDNLCRRSNIDFTNIGKRMLQRRTSGSVMGNADDHVIQEERNDVEGGIDRLTTTSNGDVVAGPRNASVSQAAEPDAMFAMPDHIFQLPVRSGFIN
jgi:hypothetical protein